MKLLSHSIILERSGTITHGDVPFSTPPEHPRGTRLTLREDTWHDMGWPLEIKVVVEPADRAPII